MFLGRLNFKVLELFNLAFLAKQGWRIMQEDNNLIHYVYKAIYFPLSYFLKTKLGNKPSYIWKGIVEALLWLHQHYIWRLKTSIGVDVWQDQWILNTPSLLYLCGVHAESNFEIKVSNLILKMIGNWNVEKIFSIFPPNIALSILKMKILPTTQLDKLIWAHEKTECSASKVLIA